MTFDIEVFDTEGHGSTDQGMDRAVTPTVGGGPGQRRTMLPMWPGYRL
jgi:hypothetical protein